MNNVDWGRRRAVWVSKVAVFAGLSLLVTACAQIPMSGTVERGLDDVSVPRSGYLLASGPTRGADQIETIEGFLRALSAGPEDDFAVAREYLLEEARHAWTPTERVVVHPSSTSLEVVLEDDNFVELALPVSATVDDAGHYAPAAEGVEEEFTFTLEQNVEDEWRIAKAPNVTLMSVANFEFLFRPTPIYFLSHDLSRMVPELRWFSERNQAPAAAASVLAGPSLWLQEAVYKRAPTPVRLSSDAVLVSDGTATVGLTDHILNSSLTDRGVLAVEMEQTLTGIPNIDSVELLSGDIPLELPPDLPEVDRDPVPVRSLLALGSDEDDADVLMEFADGQFNEREGMELPLEPVQTFAVPFGDSDSIAVSTEEAVLQVRPADDPMTLLVQEDVSSLSWDVLDWLWVGIARETNQLLAINTAGQYQEVAADWLHGREILTVRVARDGARILIISRDSTGTSLDVAAIRRDEAGRPESLAEPLSLTGPFKNPTTAVWVDDLEIAMLAERSAGDELTPFLIEVGGRVSALSSVDGANWLAAGKGERNLYLAAKDGRIYVRNGQTWSPVAEDIRDPHFSG